MLSSGNGKLLTVVSRGGLRLQQSGLHGIGEGFTTRNIVV